MLFAVPPGGLPPEPTVDEFVKSLDLSDSEWVLVVRSVDGELILDMMGVTAERLSFALDKVKLYLLDEF